MIDVLNLRQVTVVVELMISLNRCLKGLSQLMDLFEFNFLSSSFKLLLHDQVFLCYFVHLVAPFVNLIQLELQVFDRCILLLARFRQR